MMIGTRLSLPVRKSAQSVSRRSFLATALPLTAGVLSGTSGSLMPAHAASSSSSWGALFEDYVIRPRPRVQEAILTKLKDGRYWLLFGENKRLVGMYSSDFGRTWSQTAPLTAEDGSGIMTARDSVHLSLLHLPSGRLGIVYGGPYSRPGRDGTVLFRTSKDGGKTWSSSVVIDPIFALCRTQGARVLSTGRILVPVFKWYSPAPGGESEDEANSLCVSWTFYSDDEGKTWSRSLSELFVSLDQGRRGAYSFEEPCLEELRDGSVLMFGRTELGRFYQTISKDGGISWSVPEPVSLAASYTPPMIVTIPATGDLLLVWNQASGEEILLGLSRHRLSTAISKNGGITWVHHRNLESLDDRRKVNVPPNTPLVYRMVDYEYRQPVDRMRYKHAPGCLRVCYPTVVFHEREVAIAYDYGEGVGEFERKHATKIKIVSLDWLYGE